MFSPEFLMIKNLFSFLLPHACYIPISYPPCFNPLNAELNPICHLLALLGTHHILHLSRIRVNLDKRIKKKYTLWHSLVFIKIWVPAPSATCLKLMNYSNVLLIQAFRRNN